MLATLVPERMGKSRGARVGVWGGKINGRPRANPEVDPKIRGAPLVNFLCDNG
jgi:hypothetical protein